MYFWNQIALNAGWDTNKLSEQLQLILDDGLDLEITGFDDDFLNDILKQDNDNELLDPLEGEKEEKVQANKFLSLAVIKFIFRKRNTKVWWMPMRIL